MNTKPLRRWMCALWLACGCSGPRVEQVLQPVAGAASPPPTIATTIVPGPDPVRICRRGGLCQPLRARPVTKLDLLLVVDDSASMASAQAALRARLPDLITDLTFGVTGRDPWVQPFTDIQLGVVSTDMGTVGATTGLANCSGGGDDGRLQHANVAAAGCAERYPQFLTYRMAGDRERVSADLACLSQLGTRGCAVKQPLEAALKALWPADYLDATGATFAPDIRFLAESPDGWRGHGGVLENMGGNGEFVRHRPRDDLSNILVAVVTDGDDCSSSDPNFLAGSGARDPNVRCASNAAWQYSIERYINGFQALRPRLPRSVGFAMIAGSPCPCSTCPLWITNVCSSIRRCRRW